MTNAFLQFEEDVVNFVKTEVESVSAGVNNFLLKIEPIAVSDLEALWAATKQLAITVVIMFAQQEFAALTGAQKQANVIANVTAYAKAQGLKVTSAMAQTVAQQAYTVVATNLPEALPKTGQ